MRRHWFPTVQAWMSKTQSSLDEQDTKQLGKLDVGEAYCYYSYMRALYRVITLDACADEHIRLDVSSDETTR